MSSRVLSLRLSSDGTPVSLDADTRSFEAIGASENPVEVWDWDRFEVVKEVLMMDGCEMPSNRQVPLLDTHSRWNTASVMGSYRSMKTESGQLVGRVFFSSAPEAEGAYLKAREGHLTDFSVGYRVVESTWVPAGEKQNIRGRSFDGPVRVTTRWRVKELSICPIGADEAAKARSQQEHQIINKETHMDPRLRAYLQSRGLAADATEEAAWAFLTKIQGEEAQRAAAAAAAGNQPDVDKLRRDATGAERERIIGIDAMCKRAKREDLAKDFIVRGTAIEVVRQQLMDIILTSVENEGGYGHRTPAVMGADERDKFRCAAQDGLMLRIGARIEKPAPGAIDLRGHSLREIARDCLRMAGQSLSGNVMEMVGRALTVSDFPLILSAVANKSLMDGWESADETWKMWCATGSVSDFKVHTAVRASETDDLDQIPDKAPYKYGERTEAQEQYNIATFGKLLAITRQAIINDDTSALSDVPKQHGESAARTVGDVAYAVLTANAAMGDGLALFVAGHGNFVANGAGAPPGIATLAAGILAMGLQTDARGLRRLNLRPQFLIAPRTLEGAAEVFFLSNNWFDAGANVATDASLASTRGNPYAGKYFTRVYEARLDAADVAAWYLAAKSDKTVKVFFLNGQQAPYMETKQGWIVDGVEYKVRIDVGAKAMDWRGLYYNDGN